MLEEVLSSLLNKPEHEKNHILSLYKQLLEDEKVRQLTSLLANITDDSGEPTFTRADTLSRIERYINSANRDTVKSQQGEIKPITTSFTIVCVDFAGLGSELDNFHYGIVWEEQRKRDNVSIIPTTSFKSHKTIETDLTFNIGRVGFLQGETVVLMSQITSVSRKRIRKVRHLNPTTNSRENVKLLPMQQNRIKDGFRIYGLKERSLYNEFIRESFLDTLPILGDPELQFNHLNRPVRIVNNSKGELTYQLYGDEKIHSIKRAPYILPAAISRNKLLKNWVEAVAKIDASSKFEKSREDIRQQAYSEIQSAIQSFEDIHQENQKNVD
jgi:hypothetical protein